MKNLLPVVVLALAGFGLGLANERYGLIDFANQPLDGRKVVCDVPPPAEKQIIKLPEDGGAYHTSLFLPANWKDHAQSRELVAWFETDNKLKSLKAQTHFHIYPQNDPMFVNRYRGMVPKVPAVIIQKPSGQFVYESGLTSSIPNSPSALAADIQGYLYSNCPRRPKPEPTPETEPVVDKDGPPKLVEPDAPQADSPLILALLGALAGGLVGVGLGYYEQYYNGGKNVFGPF